MTQCEGETPVQRGLGETFEEWLHERRSRVTVLRTVRAVCVEYGWGETGQLVKNAGVLVPIAVSALLVFLDSDSLPALLLWALGLLLPVSWAAVLLTAYWWAKAFIEIDRHSLCVGRAYWGIRFKRTHPVGHVRNVRVAQTTPPGETTQSEQRAQKRKREERLSIWQVFCDFDGKPKALTDTLTLEAAEKIVAAIHEFAPELRPDGVSETRESA